VETPSKRRIKRLLKELKKGKHMTDVPQKTEPETEPETEPVALQHLEYDPFKDSNNVLTPQDIGVPHAHS
jgi:hypothetical protein